MGSDPVRPQVVQRDLVEGHDVSSVVGATEYSFRSAMLRDVAYESVLLKDRRVFHERAARWLEAQEKTMVGASAASIAAHWDRAGEAVRAARWRIEAGKAARAIAAVIAIGVAVIGFALVITSSVVEADESSEQDGESSDTPESIEQQDREPKFQCERVRDCVIPKYDVPAPSQPTAAPQP